MRSRGETGKLKGCKQWELLSRLPSRSGNKALIGAEEAQAAFAF